jgi:hypothetical protein
MGPKEGGYNDVDLLNGQRQKKMLAVKKPFRIHIRWLTGWLPFKTCAVPAVTITDSNQQKGNHYNLTHQQNYLLINMLYKIKDITVSVAMKPN